MPNWKMISGAGTSSRDIGVSGAFRTYIKIDSSRWPRKFVASTHDLSKYMSYSDLYCTIFLLM